MRLFAILLLTLSARAAVVEGVILDQETGNPLARTEVALMPLPGTSATITPVRTGARGSFVILSVTPGWYILRATRRGYAAAESGQVRPGRPGHAFQVADDRSAGFLEIRMSRLPAITGAVLDENGVGIPKWQVFVYSARKPVRRAAKGVTDERGNFRIGELDPGAYLVRSGPGLLEDQTTLIATYAKAATEIADAIPLNVHAGETVHDVVIRPLRGHLFTISGTLLPVPKCFANLTLVTDTDRREIASGGDPTPFSATGVQPGPVEIIVKGKDLTGKECGSYTRLVVTDKDISSLRLACGPFEKLSVTVTGGTLKSPLVVRRVDLDGASESHPLVPNEILAPGHWELSVPTTSDYYAFAVRNQFGPPLARNGAWYGFDAGTYTRLWVQLSPRPASISGVVSTRGNPVAGAPIFLRDKDSGQTWTGRADPQGNYRMQGLAPGAYTIISGFDLDPDAIKPDDVATAEGGNTVHPLELVLP